MEFLTGFLSALAGAIILVTPPAFGMAVYTAVLVWYPLKLTIKLGTIDFSASRILILIVLLKLLVLSGQRVKQFRLIAMDYWVIVFFAAQLFSGMVVAQDFTAHLINRFGGFFDFILPYFAFRLFLQRYKDFLRYIILFSWTVVPYMIVGFYQFLTGVNLYTPLLEHAAWGSQGDESRQRFGFYRAYACMPVHILYGLFFMQAVVLLASLYRAQKRYKLLWWIGLGGLIMGVLTSLSSGPYLALMAFAGFMLMYQFRQYWRPIVITGLLMIGFVEVASNRHFYEVIDRFTMNSASAWYRSRLMDVALFEGGMSGHWAFGYGFDVDPRWCDNIDGRDHTDIVNHYLVILSRYGLVALVPFFGIVGAAYRSLYKTFQRAGSREVRWMTWSLFAGLSGLLVVFFTVSLFGQPETFFYILLAFCGSIPLLASRGKRRIRKARPRRQRMGHQDRPAPELSRRPEIPTQFN